MLYVFIRLFMTYSMTMIINYDPFLEALFKGISVLIFEILKFSNTKLVETRRNPGGKNHVSNDMNEITK